MDAVKRKGDAMRTGSRVKTGSIVALLGLCMALSVIGSVHAAMQADVPRISIQELKKMMDEKTPVTIIDVQPKDIYEMGHIKGAISLPWKSQIALEDVWSLPSDQLIVTYCDCGPGESDSASVAAQLFQFGYDNVKVLGDPSIRGWKELNYPIEKSQKD
jgi:rhodanese-related sulfurtransferase